MNKNGVLVQLTKEQRKHIKSMQWLFTGSRGSGRTTLLAYVLIDAVLCTGQEMRIIDHVPSRTADMHLANLIDMIVSKNELPLEISFSSLILKKK